MSQTYHYNSGLPFTESLAGNLASLQKEVIENNKACSLVIDGAIGSGKTILSVQVADFFNGAYTYDEQTEKWTFDETKAINLNEQYGFGSKVFLKNLLVCVKKKHKVLIFDEAGDFSKRGSLTKLNADVNRAFEICRKFKIIIILVLPNFYYLDKAIFDKQMIKGLFRVSREYNTYADYRLWGADGIDWIKYYTQKIPIPNQAYNIVRPYTTGHSLPLTKERGEMLEKIGESGKKGVLSQINLVANDTEAKFLSASQIGFKYGVSKQTAWNFINDNNLKVMQQNGTTNLYSAFEVDKIVQKYGIKKIGK